MVSIRRTAVVINACFCLVLVSFIAHFGNYRKRFLGNFEWVFYRQWFGVCETFGCSFMNMDKRKDKSIHGFSAELMTS